MTKSSELQSPRPRVYVALLHYPMLNRTGDEVTTAVTNLDIHDIARTCRTYGVDRYFIVNPNPGQSTVVQRIIDHWASAQAKAYHPKRVEALDRVTYLQTFEQAIAHAQQSEGGIRPVVAMPDARDWPQGQSYGALRKKLKSGEVSSLFLVFGTGWGIAPSFFDKMDVILEPLRGADAYNHLSVRAACAIVLDRLLGIE